MNYKSRLRALENKAPKHLGPPYISIQEGDDIPEGYKGKVYVGISPDDWETEVKDEKND